jgi:hypothetical protein
VQADEQRGGLNRRPGKRRRRLGRLELIALFVFVSLRCIRSDTELLADDRASVLEP